MSTETEANQEQTPSLSEAAQATLRAIGGLPTSSTVEEEALMNIGNNANASIETTENNKLTETPDPGDSTKVGAELLKDSIDKTETEEKKEVESAPGDDPGEVEAEAKTDVETEASEKKEEKEEVKETFIESAIFGGKKVIEGGSKKPSEDFNFEGADKVNEFIKSKTGLDNMEALVTTFEESKEKLAGAAQNEKEVKDIKSFFDTMPPELYQVVDAYHKGQDWKKEIMSRPNLNFDTSIDSQNEKNLVENYMPGKVSKEDWEEYKNEDGDANIKRLIDSYIDSSKKQFNIDKTGIDSFRGSEIKKAQAAQEVYLESVQGSIDYLKENIQGVDDSYIAGMRGTLTQQGVLDIFFEKNGALKKEAAQKMAMAEHGFGMLKQYEGIANHKAESKERQDILERVPEKAKAKKKAAETTDNVRPEVKQHISKTLEGTGTTSVY